MVLDRFRTAVAPLLAAPALQALAAPLTLDEALVLAEQRSRQHPAHEAAATQRPDPVLNAGINNLPLSGADRFSLTSDFMTMPSVGVMQEWTRQEKLQARSARFERETEASRQLALANPQRDTAIKWLERHYQERMRELLLQQRSEAVVQVKGAEAAYRGGRGTQADVFAARSAVAQIDVCLRDEDLDLQIAHHPQIASMLKQEPMAEAEAEAEGWLIGRSCGGCSNSRERTTT